MLLVVYNYMYMYIHIIVCVLCRTCNLATQCLRSEFSQQIRAHEFIPKITSALKDLLQHPVREGGEGETEREGGQERGRGRERGEGGEREGGRERGREGEGGREEREGDPH